MGQRFVRRIGQQHRGATILEDQLQARRGISGIERHVGPAVGPLPVDAVAALGIGIAAAVELVGAALGVAIAIALRMLARALRRSEPERQRG